MVIDKYSVSGIEAIDLNSIMPFIILKVSLLRMWRIYLKT